MVIGAGTADAGRVDQPAQRPHLATGPLHRRTQGRGLGHVHLHAERAHPVLLGTAPGHPPRRRTVAVPHRHAAPGLGQGERRGLADARAAAGDHHARAGGGRPAGVGAPAHRPRRPPGGAGGAERSGRARPRAGRGPWPPGGARRRRALRTCGRHRRPLLRVLVRDTTPWPCQWWSCSAGRGAYRPCRRHDTRTGIGSAPCGAGPPRGPPRSRAGAPGRGHRHAPGTHRPSALAGPGCQPGQSRYSGTHNPRVLTNVPRRPFHDVEAAAAR